VPVTYTIPTFRVAGGEARKCHASRFFNPVRLKGTSDDEIHLLFYCCCVHCGLFDVDFFAGHHTHSQLSCHTHSQLS